MSTMRKLLCLCMAFAMFLPLLSGCMHIPPNGNTPSEESGEESKEEPSAVIDLSGYTLIRPTGCTAELAKASAELLMAISQVTGSDLPLREDYIPAGTEVDPDAKEILLGLTNRAQSQEALAELGDQFSFSIRVTGNKIVILGTTAELTVKAIDLLYEQYLPRAEGDGKLTVPTSYVSHPQSYQEIITEGTVNYQLVYSRIDAGSANFLPINNLMNAINEHAGTPISYTDDWIQAGTEHDLNKKAIVVGATTYPRSTELLNENGFFGWALSVEGNQVYAAAYEAASLNTACKALEARIENGVLWGKEKTVRICQDTEPVYGTLIGWNQELPEYEGGTMQSLREFTPDHYRLYYTKTTRAAYDAYVKKLEDAGFALYSANTLDENTFRTYFKGDLMVHVYYTAKKLATSILMAHADTAERFPLAPYSRSTASAEPTLTLMNMNYSSQQAGNNGMGFVFTLADGSFVIIDGGYATEAEKLYNFLVANSEDGQPLIRAWILTHPDGDHYTCFTQFANRYAADVTLEYFVAQFDNTMLEGSASAAIQAIRDGVALFEGCKPLVPLTGQKMFFGTLEVDFLYTAEALHPTSVTSHNNEHSLVMRTRFAEKTVLFMADVMNEGLNWVTTNYTDALKCDYIQAPHHGLNGNTALYNRALPEYLILCTNETAAQSRLQLTNNGLNQLMQKRDENDQPIVKQVFAADHSYSTLIPNEQSATAGIPELSGGTLTSVKEFTPGYYRYYYTNCTRAVFDAYLETLTANGFELYGTNTIDANVYNTYYSGSVMLHAYYLDATGTVSLLTTDALNAVAYPKTPVSDGAVTTPTVAMASLDYDADRNGAYDHNNGMGFVFTLADGSYVIIDGGYAADAEPLYQYLLANNKRTDGKILIRAWIITHPDGDHYKCFLQFAKKHAKDVTLEYLVAQFDQDRINSGAIEEVVNSVFAAQRKFAGSRRLVPLIGQKMYFGDLEMEFLFTAEALHPTVVNYNNEHSLVMKVPFGGKTFLLAADVVGVSINWLTLHYTNALKCDFFQAPHHALNGTRALYDKTTPTYLLMCTHKVAANERWNQGRYNGQSQLAYLKGLGCVRKVYVADTGTPGFITLMTGETVVEPPNVFS